MSPDKLRRGISFGGFSLIMAAAILPIAVALIWEGPLGPIGTGALVVLIAAITAGGFYLGYSGWGKRDMS